jgi:heat shock protein HslJ
MKNILVSLLLIIFLLAGCSLPGQVREETSPIVTLYIGPKMVTCDNPLRNNLCYQVKDSPEQEWGQYKGEIMGFLYEPDFVYELKVRKDSLSAPSANAPEQQWVLMEQIQKTANTAGQISGKDELAGPAWSLDQFGSPQKLSMALGDPVPTIFFQKDGHFTGSTGCNRFNGSFTTDSFRVVFDSVAATKKMCSGQAGMLEQEQTILKTVETAQRYQITDGKLFLFSSGDALVLIFKK